MNKITKLVNDAIIHVAGKNAIIIGEILFGKSNVNEFLIAKKINLTINQTRNILYKLLEAGMVSFTRKKDKDKAWYTYFWTLDIVKTLHVLEKYMLKDIEQSQNQLDARKTKRFYLCKNCSIEVGEETALLNDFTCTECGTVYELNNDPKILEDIQAQIQRLERARAEILVEIEQYSIQAEKRNKKKAAKKADTKEKKPKKKK